MSSLFKLLKLKDYITLIGTVCGLVALMCAVMSASANVDSRILLSIGFYMIVISIGTDTLDGYVARKTGTVNEIGKELDSLSDCLTFGIAPSVLIFQAFRTGSLYDIILAIGCIAFALGALLRLARFNISSSKGYTGVPTPLSALLMITFFYCNYFYAVIMGGPGDSGLTHPFPEISVILIPFILIFIGWLNITTYINFGEKGKGVYIMFMVFAPLAPILGILGLLSNSVLAAYYYPISWASFVFFLAIFLIEIGYFIISLFIKSNKNEK